MYSNQKLSALFSEGDQYDVSQRKGYYTSLSHKFQKLNKAVAKDNINRFSMSPSKHNQHTFSPL